MADATPRNAPCPCGSGKKYKHCHLGKELGAERGKKKTLFIALVVLALGGGAAGWALKGFELGVAIAAGILVVGGMVVVFRDPPPPSGGGGDPAGLNFGN